MKHILAIAILGFLSVMGCASTPPLPNHMVLVRNDSQANLAIVCDTRAGGVTFALFDGDTELGRLWSANGMNVHLSPGIHMIAVAPATLGVLTGPVAVAKVYINDRLQTIRLSAPDIYNVRLELE